MDHRANHQRQQAGTGSQANRAAAAEARLRANAARWLAAEADPARGDDRVAEWALGELFGALPRTSLPNGFAVRVMARVAAEPALWKLERAAAWALLLCAASLLAVPLWLPRVWEGIDLGTLARFAVDALVWVTERIAELAPLWAALAKVAHLVGVVSRAPQVLTVLAASGLVAATAGRLLLAMLDERSPRHAQV